MNIPEQAIEAAANTIAGPYGLDDEDALNAATEAIEAAAPHIAAQAWTEGFMAGRLVEINGWPTNPYSSDALSAQVYEADVVPGSEEDLIRKEATND